MNLAVCETPAEWRAGDAYWRALPDHLTAGAADLVLVSEMPFGRWVAADARVATGELAVLHRLHAEGLARLGELGVPAVLGSRPAVEGGRTVNRGFVWTRQHGLRDVHAKQFFPEEPGYWERRWFARGADPFRVADAGGVNVGFLICTDVWFVEWARHYRRQGAQLIAVPRATPPGSEERWLVAMRMAAIVSGCYVASANRSGRDGRGEAFAGRGWIVDPFGEVLAETSQAHPVVTAPLDLARVERARREYPCYVEELPHTAQRVPNQEM